MRIFLYRCQGVSVSTFRLVSVSSFSILPSTMAIRRRARSPSSGSWVTISRVNPFAVETLQDFHDFVAGGPIEIAGRLIGQQHGGPGDRGPRYGHPLPLAAGKLIRTVVLAIENAERTKQILHPFFTLIRRHPGQDQGQFDIFSSCQARHQMEKLKDKANRCLRTAAISSSLRVTTSRPSSR